MRDYKDFLRKYRVKYYAKGEVILNQSESPEGAYIIKSGVVKSYDLTLSGEEKPIAFNLKNELFPIGWVFQKINKAQYFYEAFSDCAVYIVPAEDYRKFLLDNPAREHELFIDVLGRYITYQMRVNALEQSKAVDKILHTLFFLGSRYGISINANKVRVDLPLTQQDMANFMGLTRETTAIELKKMEKNGMFSHKYRSYVIDMNKLQIRLGQEYNKGGLFDNGKSNL
jgi:CRP/FNR family transcriptional regulator